MHGENGTPETPDWVPTPKPWDESACCGICMTAAESVWVHGTDEHLIRGEN